MPRNWYILPIVMCLVVFCNFTSKKSSFDIRGGKWNEKESNNVVFVV